jgi:hypothetical protein
MKKDLISGQVAVENKEDSVQDVQQKYEEPW